jgi:hypothetical protein
MAKNKKHLPKFSREVAVLKDVHRECSTRSSGGAVGFPLLYHHEILKDSFTLVMERLGPSLKDIRDQMCKKFSLKNIIMLGIQIVLFIKALLSTD